MFYYHLKNCFGQILPRGSFYLIKNIHPSRPLLTEGSGGILLLSLPAGGRLVAELELQGSVDVPEIAGLGLRLEVDEKTRRAKLVNVS